MSATPGCLVFVGTVMRPVPHFAAQGGAAIALSPSGDNIYVSNRRPGGISLLRPDAVTGALQLIGCRPSGGKTRR
ncbi:MAG TPA: beta-propeller fold lactonase family protein [Acetobacteraceae bacterium]|jgi:6-phosphogluconolactonase (cycloisomerase 2 family)|nr:beta-propeller fold lactonase family protein [Acetobacteraceae bacterium]